MNAIEKMVAELCPEGVEFVKVKERFQRIKGTNITAGIMKEIASPDGDIRIFGGGRTTVTAREIDIPNANITRVPAVLVQSRGIINFVYFDRPFTFKNELWAYTADEPITLRFLCHILNNNVCSFKSVFKCLDRLVDITRIVI